MRELIDQFRQKVTSNTSASASASVTLNKQLTQRGGMLWHVCHYHVPCGQTAIQKWIKKGDYFTNDQFPVLLNELFN